MKAVLSNEKIDEVMNLLNQLPISHLNQVQKIANILNASVQEDEDKPKKPPIGGGGGTVIPTDNE